MRGDAAGQRDGAFGDRVGGGVQGQVGGVAGAGEAVLLLAGDHGAAAAGAGAGGAAPHDPVRGVAQVADGVGQAGVPVVGVVAECFARPG